MQQRIINRVESDPHYQRYLQSFEPTHDSTAAAAIILAARQIARTVNAKSDCKLHCWRYNCSQSLQETPLKETSRQLALSWGVYSEFSSADSYDTDNFRDMLRSACEIALKRGLVQQLDFPLLFPSPRILYS